MKNRLITLFVAFTVAFTSLWATSPDALADAFKADSTIQLELQALSHTHHDQAPQNQTCNHGCHAVFHLLGFAEENSASIVGLPKSSAWSIFSNNLLDNPHLQGLFRPPLVTSLV